jgi:hypothetical protein
MTNKKEQIKYMNTLLFPLSTSTPVMQFLSPFRACQMPTPSEALTLVTCVLLSWPSVHAHA